MPMSQWTNKYSIMQDLAEVTQGQVAVDIASCMTADRPSANVIEEEIEDEYFKYCTGDANFEAPDLESIKNMLSMVQQIDAEDIHESSIPAEKDAVEILKTKAQVNLNDKLVSKDVNETLPEDKTEELSNKLKETILKTPITISGKRERNVAMASLLKLNAGVTPLGYESMITKDDTQTKLLKPNHFVTMQHPDVPVEIEAKITPSKHLVDLKMSPAKPKNIITEKAKILTSNTTKIGPVMASTSMFKKKSKTDTSSPTNAASPTNVKTPPPKIISSYVPTAKAKELFKSFEEKKLQAVTIQEDIWAKAERLMKEIDAKKQLQAHQEKLLDEQENVLEIPEEELEKSEEIDRMESCAELGDCAIIMDNGVEKRFPKEICLPQHRHQLTGQCEVCRVLCTHRRKED